MKSAEKTISQAAIMTTAICAVAAAGVSLLLQPATELVQAQIQPARRMSGESPVRVFDLMKVYADLGVKTLTALESVRKPVPIKQEDATDPNPPPVVLPKDYDGWQKEVVTSLGDKRAKTPEQQQLAGKEYVSEMQKAVGDQDFKKLVDLYLADPNYCYYAYALVLGIAMFLSSVAILAIGKYEAEEITVIPVK